MLSDFHICEKQVTGRFWITSMKTEKKQKNICNDTAG